MKKIEHFKNKSKINLSFIYGGVWINTRHTSLPDSNGCVTFTMDKFNDTNGDGKYNKGVEEQTISMSTECP